jgi:YVTN family beta-propeller protein
MGILGLAVVLLLSSGTGVPPGIESAPPSPVAHPPPAALPGSVHDYHFTTVGLQRPGWSGTPAWLAYDHGVGSFYVAEAPSGVGVIPAGGWNVNVTIPVGSSPFAVAYDSTDSRLFVTNTGSDNVSVISDVTNTTVGSISVGTSPYGVAFDNRTDRVYVANGGSDTVTVVNGSSLAVLTTIAVGTDPIGVAYDPVNSVVVVANSGSDNVSVIDAATERVVASPAVGDSPYDVAVDTSNGAAYISNAASGNVTVLNQTGTGVAATIPVGVDLAGLTYDSRNNTVWVDQGPIGVVVIYAATNQVVQFLEFDPQGAAYDPDQNLVCVTNAGNSTFQCLVPGSYYSDLVDINFVESGLPNGTAWSVTLGGVAATSTTKTIEFAAPTDFYASYTVGPVAQYSATPAMGDYGGNGQSVWNVSINFTLDPSLFVLTFAEQGLTLGSGVWWGVNVSVGNLSGRIYSTDLPTIGFTVANGSYPYDPVGPGILVSPAGDAVVNGSNITVTVPFAAARFPVAVEEVDLPAGLSWSMTFNGTQKSLITDGGNDTLDFAPEPSGQYPYSIAPVRGWVPTDWPLSGTWDVSGAALNLSIEYSIVPLPPNATYRLTFQESGLPNGTNWGVVLGSSVASTATRNVTFTEENGSYAFVVLAVAGYVASAPSVAVVFGNNTTVPVTFRLATYPIVFVEFGLPAGTNWSVTVANTTTGFNLTEHSTTNSITFFLPNGTYAISFGLPPGYTGSSSSTQITVTGRAGTGATLSVAAPATRSASPAALWETVAIFAVVGAIAAAGVTLLWRRRAPPSTSG